ncbi:hypothetical protein Tco_1213054 [Tanacetum coccineum]
MVDPIRLDFKEEDTEVRENHVAKGKAVVDNDLKKPFKEAIRTPLTRRIIEFTGPETSRYNLLVADQKESGGIHRRYVSPVAEGNAKPQRKDGNNRNTRIRSSIDCGFDVGLVVNGDLARLDTIVKLG